MHFHGGVTNGGVILDFLSMLPADLVEAVVTFSSVDTGIIKRLVTSSVQLTIDKNEISFALALAVDNNKITQLKRKHCRVKVYALLAWDISLF